MTRMSETPFFFSRGDAQLFGLLHAPEGATRDLAFVTSHSFGEEKLWSHRVFVSFARALAQRGYPVLRFDYMGAGDSSGDTRDTSLDTHLADLSAAVDALQERQPGIRKVGFMGLRLGAAFAALLAERYAAVERNPLQGAPLLLWEPVLDGLNYFQELLRSNLSTQLAVYGKVRENREVLQQRIQDGGSVNVDGYEIGSALFGSCARADLLTTEQKRHTGPTLVVQVSANAEQKNREDLEALARCYPDGRLERAVEQAFWREIRPFYGRAENLQRVSLQWLEQVHG